MRRNFLSALATTLLCIGTVQAQERPDFTGTWVKDLAATQPGDGTTLKITDTPALLTVERTSGGQTETLTFSFVGEPEALKLFRTRPDEIAGPTIVQEAKAFWHGDHLDTFVARQVSGKTVTQNIRYTLDRNLTRMTVEQNLQIHHGYEGSSEGTSKPVSDVYFKR